MAGWNLKSDVTYTSNYSELLSHSGVICLNLTFDILLKICTQLKCQFWLFSILVRHCGFDIFNFDVVSGFLQPRKSRDTHFFIKINLFFSQKPRYHYTNLRNFFTHNGDAKILLLFSSQAGHELTMMSKQWENDWKILTFHSLDHFLVTFLPLWRHSDFLFYLGLCEEVKAQAVRSTRDLIDSSFREEVQNDGAKSSSLTHIVFRFISADEWILGAAGRCTPGPSCSSDIFSLLRVPFRRRDHHDGT